MEPPPRIAPVFGGLTCSKIQSDSCAIALHNMECCGVAVALDFLLTPKRWAPNTVQSATTDRAGGLRKAPKRGRRGDIGICRSPNWPSFASSLSCWDSHSTTCSTTCVVIHPPFGDHASFRMQTLSCTPDANCWQSALVDLQRMTVRSTTARLLCAGYFHGKTSYSCQTTTQSAMRPNR